MQTRLSRSYAVAGERARPGRCDRRPRRSPSGLARRTHVLVTRHAAPPPGRGAGWLRPGRACSPFPTAWFRLRHGVQQWLWAVCLCGLLSLSAQAHPISLTSATVEVATNQVTARLEVMCEDFVMLYAYVADKDNYISRSNLQEGMKKHTDLLLRDFMIRDRDGQLLSGKLVKLEEPVLAERGVLVDDLMQTKVIYNFVYPVARLPEYLTFQQKIGGGSGGFLPSIMQLTVRQVGAEARPIVALNGEGDVQTFQFAWLASGVAESASGTTVDTAAGQPASNMGIESYGAVYAFLYITPAEVRIEILMPLLTLETWTEVPRKDNNFLEVAEQQAALPALQDFFRGHNKVTLDGLEVRPVLQRLDFYGVDFKDFAVAAEPRRLSAWTARVGVILAYSTKGLPNQVAVTWDLFNPRVLSARAAVFAGEEAKPCRFTRYQPTFNWKNPGLPHMPEITPVEAKNPDQKTRVRIADTLLKNIYRAFDYRDEKAIYDALARSVHGDLLADTYLQIHAGLLMQEQGGAVSHVRNVELLNTSIADAQPTSYNAQVKWRVTGTVEHWGHIHTRVNAYEALLRVSRGDGAWKITGMEVGKQERVSYQLKVRKF